MAYLDHAATTPMTECALATYTEALAEFGNPSSLHTVGRRARRRVEEARERIGTALGARPSEVIFTGGGTESDNVALKGAFWGRNSTEHRRPIVVTSAIEHHAVLDTAQWLADHEDAEHIQVPVDMAGVVDEAAFTELIAELGDAVAVASVMWANNEVGTVQPVAELAAIAAAANLPFHTDAVQAIGQVPVDFAGSGATALTLTSHKIGGPNGVGALLVRRDAELTPLTHGGGQERKIRSGTLNTAGIVAFAQAVADAVAERETNAKHLAALRDRLVAGVRRLVPDVIETSAGASERLPGNAHLIFAGCEGDSLLMLLDAAGVYASTGSACAAGIPQPSHVLLAMGHDALLARGSLRFTLGHTSTDADVDALLAAIGPAVERAKQAGMGR